MTHPQHSEIESIDSDGIRRSRVIGPPTDRLETEQLLTVRMVEAPVDYVEQAWWHAVGKEHFVVTGLPTTEVDREEFRPGVSHERVTVTGRGRRAI